MEKEIIFGNENPNIISFFIINIIFVSFHLFADFIVVNFHILCTSAFDYDADDTSANPALKVNQLAQSITK